MRLRVHVYTAAKTIPWEEVHRPGRALIYSLLHEADPALGEHIHNTGWGTRGMTPFGFCPPVFPAAPRQDEVYAAGGAGWLEIGTPVAAVARAIGTAIQNRRYIDWGGVALRVNRCEVLSPPSTLAAGYAVWTTLTPVVVKSGDSRREATRWLLPGDKGWDGRVGQNSRRKAATLGLEPRVGVDEVLWVGATRSYVVAPDGDGRKVGARVKVRMVGNPNVLRALWCWGLGEATSAGMGWIAC